MKFPLNDPQRAAVRYIDGPLLVLAGAGSGKTRVITAKIAHLIEQGADPAGIAAITFTNKAAREMRERTGAPLRRRDGAAAAPTICTFHALGLKILRREAAAMQLTPRFSILDPADIEPIVAELLATTDRARVRAAQWQISAWKNALIAPAVALARAATEAETAAARVYGRYRAALSAYQAVDFDDLIALPVAALESDAGAAAHWQQRLDYLLIDEYQDTNRPQYELMRMLAGDRHNVCAVGDEDQSIYSWRGADIRNILEFEKDFPEAKIIRLEQNYRSTQNILQAASSVVANNIRRKGKNLWTSRQGGTKIGYYEAPDGENEALFAADHIAKYLREAGRAENSRGDTPRAAVLYRTNSQSRLFEEAMRRYGLKYHVVGGFSFYERAEIKDMISYLKVIQNPDDSISLLRVINTPTRGIGKGTIDTLERLALETGLSLWGATGEAIRRQLLPPRALSALKNFQQLIVDAQAMLSGTFVEQLEESTEGESVARAPSSAQMPTAPQPVQASADDALPDDASAFDPNEFENTAFDFGGAYAGGESESSAGVPPAVGQEEKSVPLPSQEGVATTADLLKFLIDRTRYIKVLEDEDTPEAFSRIENLRELVNAAMDSRDRGESLDQFLDHAALISDADDYDERSQITLMSLHAAKGLEFPLVFLSGLEEGLFPHSRTMLQPDDVEEERRLCYVGMTRAMDQLILTRAVYRRRYGTDLPEASVPSRFLEEVPIQLIEELGGRRNTARAGTASVGTGTLASLPRAQSRGPAGRSPAAYDADVHYSYEDEDQSASWKAPSSVPASRQKPTAPAKPYNSIENIAEFFASRGKKFTVPKTPVEAPTGKRGFRPGQKVRHPKYGEGTVYQREGEGEEAKITVQFPRFGLKKLVEKYAQLERA
jgi:DNA helicase II / ATP-dependent DNA helicase PcrA